MAENQNTAPAQEENGPQFAIQRIYLKDASLEMPHAPQIFLLQDAPEISIQVDVEQTKLADAEDLFEVVVRGTVTAKSKANGQEQTVFLVECKQAGIFFIHNIPQEHLPMILGITCPAAIYPYLRSNVSDLLTRAGMPPVYMGDIDFQAMFAQRVQQEAMQAQAAQAAEANTVNGTGTAQ